MDHPLDRRLGAGHYNEAQWTTMASDGRLAPEKAALQPGQPRGVDLDRPSGELTHEEPEIVLLLPRLARLKVASSWSTRRGYIRRDDWPLGSYARGRQARLHGSPAAHRRQHGCRLGSCIQGFQHTPEPAQECVPRALYECPVTACGSASSKSCKSCQGLCRSCDVNRI